MKNNYSYFKKIYLILSIIVGIYSSKAQEPFNCVEEAYLFQTNDVYAQNLASGNATLEGIDLAPDNINGVGYNDQDGYIWGSLRYPDNSIIRIGKDYSTTIYTLSDAPFSYVGDVSPGGTYYLRKTSTSYYKIDLDPNSPTYLTNIGTETISQSLNIHDWAFNAVDGKLYTVEKNSNILYRIDVSTNIVETVGEVPILSGLNYTYGAVYFDVDGNFYISANQTGTVYIVYAAQNVTSSADMTSNLFAYGPSSSSNDGARCPTAPVPQEDCTNGIDDDGDGLTDCDDPSCSGVASCPTFSPTSGGNEGGLESNNRLSVQIAQRNINRLKSNYSFDIQAARKFTKTSFYGQKTSNNSMQLSDFVPLDVLSGTTAIESSPSDLPEITNATEVISVDYMRNGSSIGTLLALKTDNEVYEHTKHICDRFTGAQILSVSSMLINDASFIKSVVKQPNGSVEFVASFSARVASDDSSFIVESHWNLDKYSNDGFYNFQIWASTIDELYILAEEVLRLLAVQKTISEYQGSDAPPVFIRSASYEQGKIKLGIVNQLSATTALIEGNKRATETSDSELLQYNIDLPSYLNEITLDTDNLYDFGFRLSNEFDLTPDDLFLSDGTWGIDYSSSPFVGEFEVRQNIEEFDEDSYGVERNFFMRSTASQDVSVYRSLTPKFEGVDLSEFELLSFKAKGDGTLKVTLVKESITDWESQPSIELNLTQNERLYTFHKNDLSSAVSRSTIDLDDVTTLFFTLVSENGVATEKELDVSDIQFLKSGVASVDDESLENTVLVSPNPMVTTAEFTFNTFNREAYTFEVFNLFGKQVYKEEFESVVGKNTLQFERDANLASGVYFYRIRSTDTQIKGKILMK